MIEKAIDPRDPEQLGHFIHAHYSEALRARGRSCEDWSALDDVARSCWRETARRVHDRFAPESAADVPLDEGA